MKIDVIKLDSAKAGSIDSKKVIAELNKGTFATVIARAMGAVVPSGVYLYAIRAGKESVTGTVAVAR